MAQILNLLCHLTPWYHKILLSYREASGLETRKLCDDMCSWVLALCTATEWRTHAPVNAASLYILALLHNTTYEMKNY